MQKWFVCDLEFELLILCNFDTFAFTNTGSATCGEVASYILKKVSWLRSFIPAANIHHSFFFIPPRPIMAKSACLYLHVSLSYYLVKCGVFFLRRRRCILSWGIFSGFVIWWIKQIELCQWVMWFFFYT